MTKAEFRDAHLPALRVMCASFGLPLAWRNLAFADASDGVMLEAMRRGADRRSR